MKKKDINTRKHGETLLQESKDQPRLKGVPRYEEEGDIFGFLFDPVWVSSSFSVFVLTSSDLVVCSGLEGWATFDSEGTADLVGFFFTTTPFNAFFAFEVFLVVLP